MKKLFFLGVCLFLFFSVFSSVSAVPPKSYVVEIKHVSGDLFLNSVDVDFAFPDRVQEQTDFCNKLVITDFSGNVLFTNYFYVSSTIFPVGDENNDFQSDPFILDDFDFVLVMPYFSNAQFIRIYDPDDRLLLTADVSHFAELQGLDFELFFCGEKNWLDSLGLCQVPLNEFEIGETVFVSAEGADLRVQVVAEVVFPDGFVKELFLPDSFEVLDEGVYLVEGVAVQSGYEKSVVVGEFVVVEEAESVVNGVSGVRTSASNVGVWFSEPFEVVFDCVAVDDSCVRTYYRVNRGAWSIGSSVSISRDGNSVVEFYSVGVSGEQEPVQKVFALLDSRKPGRVDFLEVRASADEVFLEWSESEDLFSGVEKYVLYRDGERYAETRDLSYSDFNVVEGGEYVYAVSAVDFAGNESDLSVVRSVTVLDSGDRVPVDNGLDDTDAVNGFLSDLVAFFSEPVGFLVLFGVCGVVFIVVFKLWKKGRGNSFSPVQESIEEPGSAEPPADNEGLLSKKYLDDLRELTDKKDFDDF